MKVQIFENFETLNKYLENKEYGDVLDIKFQSEVVGTKNGKKEFIVVDRFMVFER